MHADAGMAGAGPARHHRRRRPSGELAERLRHVHRPRLEPAGDQPQPVLHRIEPIQHIEVAFAGHGEHMIDAARHQRIGQDASARAGLDD